MNETINAQTIKDNTGWSPTDITSIAKLSLSLKHTQSTASLFFQSGLLIAATQWCKTVLLSFSSP